MIPSFSQQCIILPVVTSSFNGNDWDTAFEILFFFAVPFGIAVTTQTASTTPHPCIMNVAIQLLYRMVNSHINIASWFLYASAFFFFLLIPARTNRYHFITMKQHALVVVVVILFWDLLLSVTESLPQLLVHDFLNLQWYNRSKHTIEMKRNTLSQSLQKFYRETLSKIHKWYEKNTTSVLHIKIKF